MYQREKKLHSRVADAPQKARSSQSRGATWTLPNSPPLSFTTALIPTGGVIEEPTAAPAEMRSVSANLESNALHHWQHAAQLGLTVAQLFLPESHREQMRKGQLSFHLHGFFS